MSVAATMADCLNEAGHTIFLAANCIMPHTYLCESGGQKYFDDAGRLFDDLYVYEDRGDDPCHFGKAAWYFGTPRQERYNVDPFEDLPSSCYDSPLFSRFEELIGLLKLINEYENLGEEFEGMAYNQCGWSKDSYVNPIKAGVCIVIGQYLEEQISRESDGSVPNTLENRYLNDPQTIADSLSRSKMALLVSDVLFYASGMFLFV